MALYPAPATLLVPTLILDAVVVASAAQRGDLVLTSDVDDLGMIRDAMFPAVRLRRV